MSPSQVHPLIWMVFAMATCRRDRRLAGRAGGEQKQAGPKCRSVEATEAADAGTAARGRAPASTDRREVQNDIEMDRK